jgi:hypothetical protein
VALGRCRYAGEEGVMVLYHYTCDHGRAGIQRDGWIRPGADGLVWLTDIGPDRRNERMRKSLGLTSYSLKCDRMEFVFAADPSDAMPYREAVARGVIGRARHMLLTRLPHARPGNWFVATTSVEVVS